MINTRSVMKRYEDQVMDFQVRKHCSDPVRLDNAFSDYIACVCCFALLSEANIKGDRWNEILSNRQFEGFLKHNQSLYVPCRSQ